MKGQNVALVFALLHQASLSFGFTVSNYSFLTSLRSVHQRNQKREISSTRVCLRIIDAFDNFLGNRGSDFVKLEETKDRFGPGPLLVIYGAPLSIPQDEFEDMVFDGAPTLREKTGTRCKIHRIYPSDSSLLDLPLQAALEALSSKSSSGEVSNDAASVDIPVLFFSGFLDSEMMNTYNIVGKEIYEETAGQKSPACAKAVPNAMEKRLRQVLEEISSDHSDATTL